MSNIDIREEQQLGNREHVLGICVEGPRQSPWYLQFKVLQGRSPPEPLVGELVPVIDSTVLAEPINGLTQYNKTVVFVQQSAM